MSILIEQKPEIFSLACKVWFDKTTIYIQLLDGRVVSVPLEWFPRLRDASSSQLNKWRLIGRGIGIHWDELDEDISIEKILNP